MSDQEVNQAILGAQYKERRYLELLRILVFIVGRYIGAITTSNIKKFYALPFDDNSPKKKTGPGSKEWEEMEQRFRKRDLERAKRNKK